MKSEQQLINNIIGQLNGVNKMIAEKKDCVHVLHQIKAAKSALDSVSSKLLESSLCDCVKGGSKKSQELRKLINELVKKH